MLFDLVQIRRGKKTVVMTDQLPKVNKRMATLRSSHRKGIKQQKVVYEVIPSESNEKYKKKPHDPKLGGGDAIKPRKVKWGK